MSCELSNVTHSADALTVAGTTSSTATNVTVNSSNAFLYADNTFARTNVARLIGTNTFTAVAKDSLTRSDTNASTVNLPDVVYYAYDLNGNLLSDGQRAFDYDDENQLIRITVTNSWKSEFTYDGKGRRRVRREYSWQFGNWVVTSEVRYVYDGNLVIQERNGLNLPTSSYTRGLDLRGTREGAGGIGGLLAFSDLKSPNPSHYFYHADANVNVMMLINSEQLAVAKYLYDPFGGPLSANGPLADANLCRFSSKEYHTESSLYAFGFRFYDPSTQRWQNRDPVGEAFDFNLFRFTYSSPVSWADADGLAPCPPADRQSPCPAVALTHIGNRFPGLRSDRLNGSPMSLLDQKAVPSLPLALMRTGTIGTSRRGIRRKAKRLRVVAILRETP